MRIGLIILGLILITIGGIWSLQGGGVILGSSMSSQGIWVVIGLAAMIGGAVLLVVGAQPRRPRSGG